MWGLNRKGNLFQCGEGFWLLWSGRTCFLCCRLPLFAGATIHSFSGLDILNDTSWYADIQNYYCKNDYLLSEKVYSRFARCSFKTIFLSNHVFMQIFSKRVQAVFVYESLSYVKLTRHGFKWSCCKYTRDLFSILYRRKTESSESKTIRRSFILLAALYLKSAESA